MASRSASPESSGEAVAESSPETVLVGVIIRPQALRGEVRIQIHSDVPDRFAPGRKLLLRVGEEAPRRVRIASFRPVRGGGVIRFDGFEDRDQALAVRGGRLEVLPADVPAAPEGHYYHFELIGCRCIDSVDGELGEVTDLVEDGGGLLLEVSRARRTLSIPFVEPFLKTVDVERQEIRLELPPGLIETCASKS